MLSGFNNLESKLALSQKSKVGGDTILDAVNLRINKCDSYPYYNQKSSSTEELIKSFRDGISRLRQCFDGRNGIPSEYIRTKMERYISLIGNENIQKYITCDFGEMHSWIAVATENENSSAIEKYPQIKQYPGMIINTNRVSGNFRLGMKEDDIFNIYRFYGGRIPLEEIRPGEINPLYNYITNPTSLVIHESLHWTGSVHSNKEYPDLVYLAQACCFEQSTLEADIRDRACQALFDQEMYQNDKEARLKALREYGVRDLEKSINSLLHKASNKDRVY